MVEVQDYSKEVLVLGVGGCDDLMCRFYNMSFGSPCDSSISPTTTAKTACVSGRTDVLQKCGFLIPMLVIIMTSPFLDSFVVRNASCSCRSLLKTCVMRTAAGLRLTARRAKVPHTLRALHCDSGISRWVSFGSFSLFGYLQANVKVSCTGLVAMLNGRGLL